MMQRLPDLPDHVVGVVASGKVVASDYESVFAPAVKATLAKHGRVSVLYQLAPDFEAITPAAMWDDMKLGLTHLTAWEKIAVVTDLEWVAGASRLMGFAVPCPVKAFANSEFAEAVRWVATP